MDNHYSSYTYVSNQAKFFETRLILQANYLAIFGKNEGEYK